MTLFKTASCAACTGWPLLAASGLLVSQSGPILWPFSPLTFMTFISAHLFWSCLDFTSVTFDMTLAIGVTVALSGHFTDKSGLQCLWLMNWELFHLGTVMG